MSFHEHQSPITYRADIDGLRALAVVSVLLFHLGLGVSGGFVGVDIFFVISGYLITSIIVKDLKKGQFNMPRFWERRIRRIVPAAVVVVAVTFVLATIFFFPLNYRSFGKEMIAQALLSANVYFWQQHGYFAIDAEAFPLLHTWSLAIEEQFYLLFPMFLIWLHKKKSSKVLAWTVGILVASFVWTIYGVHAYPKATFYLLPSRAWELLIGSVLALYHFRRLPSRIWSEVLSWLGLGMMVGSMLFYNEFTPFPGPAALLPCLGAALVIFCNHNRQSTVSKLLSLRPVVFVGKISYSLYLWHWPLIVFMNYVYFYEATLVMRLSVGVLSVVLAILSWRFVENPFREKRVYAERKSIFKAFYISTGVFVLLGIAVYATRGAPFRFSDEVIACAKLAKEHPKPKEAEDIFETGELHILSEDPEIKRVAPILLWGDSHAEALLPGLDILCHEYGMNIYLATRPANPPLLNVDFPGNDRVIEFNNDVLQFIKEKQIKDVVLVARWSLYPLGNPWKSSAQLLFDPDDRSKTPKQAFQKSFQDTVTVLTNAGCRVWVMKEVPLQKLKVATVFATAMRFGVSTEGMGVSVDYHRDRQAFIDKVMDSVQNKKFHIIDPLPTFLTKDGKCRVGEGYVPYYKDRNHVSKYGARLLKPLFVPLFETAEREMSGAEKKSTDNTEGEK